MATPPLLDIDALVAAIPGKNPAGGTVPLELTDQLNEARKEINPDEYDADDPARPEQTKPADWRRIQSLTEKALRESSKDLLLASRLTEALTKQHGFAGLRDGLALLQRLLADCWDRCYPAIEEEGDLERRAGPFYWLDDPDRGARFPTSIRTIPMVSVNGTKCSWLDWKRSQEGRGPVSAGDFQQAALGMPLDQLTTLRDDAAQAREQLNQLTYTLNEKMGRHAPGLTGIRQALDETAGLIQMLAQRRSGEMAGESAGGEAVPGAPAVGPVGGREAAYRQLEAAAQTLERLEPHSPVPYLVRRAVELGKLPFPQMIKALIREANVLAELNRELGIIEEEPH